MPKTNSDGGYRLPEVIEPPDDICVQIRVPNEINHILAFWGALGALGYWWNWQRDNAKQGRLAAAVWRERIEEARLNAAFGDCEADSVRVRQRPGQPCALDVEYTFGVWEQFADLTLCQSEIVVNPDGTISIGNTTFNPQAPLGTSEQGVPIQPPPAPIPDEYTDKTCRAALNLAEVLIQTRAQICDALALSPIESALIVVGIFAAVLVYPPNVLWAIPLIAAMGATNTYCEELTAAARDELVCILRDASSQIGDVVTFNRDAILSALSASASGALQGIGVIVNFLDASSLNYAGGVPAAPEDAACPCDPPWCKGYDFTVSDYGFAVVNFGAFTPTNLGVYTTGTGFQSTTIRITSGTTRTHGVCIERAFTETTVTRVKVTYNKTDGAFTASPSPRTMSIKLFLGSSTVVDTGLIGASVTGTGVEFVWEGSVTVDRIEIRDDSSYRPGASGANGSVLITALEMRGFGDAPEGGVTCA